MQMIAAPQTSLVAAKRTSVQSRVVPSLTLRKAVIVKFKEGDREESKGLGQQLKENLSKPGEALKERLQQSVGQEAKYDESATKVNPAIPAFTRRREAFAGRLAIVGLVAAGFWEWLLPSHPNIMQQVAGGLNAAGIPVSLAQVGILISVLVLWNGVAALPFNPTWSEANQRDEDKRPMNPGMLTDKQSIKDTLGVDGFGFTKKNEVFQGRLAMLGFAAAIINQLRLGGLTGPGVLAQIAHYLGRDADDRFYSWVPEIFLTWFVLATALAYLNGKPGTSQGEEDIY